MKKLIYLFILGLGFTSCSVESLDSTENLLTADAKANLKNQVSTSAHAAPLTSYTFISGKSGNEKAKLTVSNTCDVITLNFTQLNEEPIEVKFDIFKTLPTVDVNQGNGRKTLPNGTISLTQANLDSDGNYVISFSDLGVTDADNVFVFARMGQEDAGSQVLGDWEYFTYDVTAEDCCTNELTATLVCGEVNTLTITFTTEEAGPIVIQGGLNAKAVRIGAGVGVGLEETTKPGAPGNANVSRWEGTLAACQEVSVTIDFTGGNSVGNWTATRNEVELGAAQAEDCTSND